MGVGPRWTIVLREQMDNYFAFHIKGANGKQVCRSAMNYTSKFAALKTVNLLVKDLKAKFVDETVDGRK